MAKRRNSSVVAKRTGNPSVSNATRTTSPAVASNQAMLPKPKMADSSAGWTAARTPSSGTRGTVSNDKEIPTESKER